MFNNKYELKIKVLKLMSENKSNKLSWMQIVNAIVQAVVAALTALGVSSCTTFIQSSL